MADTGHPSDETQLIDGNQAAGWVAKVTELLAPSGE